MLHRYYSCQRQPLTNEVIKEGSKTRNACITLKPYSPVLLLCLVLVSGPQVSQAQGSMCRTADFGLPHFAEVGAGVEPHSIAVGDFNSDGALDLATANYGVNTVSVVFGIGDGDFGSHAEFNVDGAPNSIITGDFNKDGRLDLATANSASGNVSVLLGNGSGGFSAAANFEVDSNSPFSITTGDFNGDNNPDLATANLSSGNISVLLGDGKGGFAPATNFDANADEPIAITTGDFNNDGKADLITANYNSGNVSIFLGNGTGSFATAKNFSVTSYPTSITVGDFNRDGKLDIVTSHYYSSLVAELLADGAGGFKQADYWETGSRSGPWAVINNDFNGDGLIDLAVADYYQGNVSVMPGNGMGGFYGPFSFTVEGSPYAIASGDFNRDGKLDLAVPNEGYTVGTSVAVVLLQNGCPSDRDLDGVPDKFDCDPLDAKNNKVLMCHKGKTLCVNQSAVQAHLKHGDHLGCCAASSKVGGEDITSASGTAIQVYPNPNNGDFTLKLQGEIAGKAEVVVLNANGTVVEKRTVMITAKDQLVQFHLGSKASGMYLIKVSSGTGIQTTKVFVQH